MTLGTYGGTINSVSWSQAGDTLAAGSGTIYLFDADKKNLRYTYDLPTKGGGSFTREVAISPDGKTVAAAVRKPDGAGGRLEVPVEVVECQQLDVNGRGCGMRRGRAPGTGSKGQEKERSVHGPPSMHRSGQSPELHRRSHTPRPALTAWLLKKLTPLPARGKSAVTSK